MVKWKRLFPDFIITAIITTAIVTFLFITLVILIRDAGGILLYCIIPTLNFIVSLIFSFLIILPFIYLDKYLKKRSTNISAQKMIQKRKYHSSIIILILLPVMGLVTSYQGYVNESSLYVDSFNFIFLGGFSTILTGPIYRIISNRKK